MERIVEKILLRLLALIYEKRIDFNRFDRVTSLKIDAIRFLLETCE